MKIAIGGVVLILAISCIAFLIKGMNGAKPEETEQKAAVELTTEPEKTVYVEGIDITGMTMDEARSAILDKFGWSMKVTWQDQTYEVADQMEEKVSALLTEIYSGTPKESYTLDTSGLEDAAKSEAAKAAAQWDKKPKTVLFPATMLPLENLYFLERRPVRQWIRRSWLQIFWML